MQSEANTAGKGSSHRNEEKPSPATRKSPSARRTQEEEEHIRADEPAGSHGPAQDPEPNGAGRSSGRASEGPSPLREVTPSPQRTYEGSPLASKRRRRVDLETTEGDAPSPRKMSAHAKSAATGSLVRSPSKAPQKSPSKLRATTPHRMESVLMPPIGTGETFGRSPQHSARETSPAKAKAKGRGSRSESALTLDTTTDREEGPSRRTSRRNAANKASQRLREEVMPDVVNFEKEMRRSHVRAVNLSNNQRGEERADSVLRASSKGKKRTSIQPTVDDALSSDGEHKRKKRRLSGTKANNRWEDSSDHGLEDVTEASSQGTAEIPPSSRGGGARGAKLKKTSSAGDTRQAEPIPHDLVR